MKYIKCMAPLLLLCLNTALCNTPSETPQVVVLKLDDVVAQPSANGLPVSPRWERIKNFLEERHIRASFGIIGYSLEQENPAYFDWIKAIHKKDQIEFWHHGYRNRQGSDPTGEFEDSFETQKQALERTQQLAKEKLGITFNVFGPHWSVTNQDTIKALESIPEITMWYYGPKAYNQFAFERVMTLEDPVHVPDFVKFKATYEQKAKDKSVLALQGHPNSWDDTRWQNFVQIIDYLTAQGCVFMTPSEYQKHLNKPFPNFTCHRIDGIGSKMGQTSLADIDRDGDLDWIVGEASHSQSRIWWWEYQDADHWLRHDLGKGNTDVGGAALDVNGDGWIDMFSGSKILINTGHPKQEPFTAHDIGAIYSHDSEFADINGDGKLDAIANSDRTGLFWYEIPQDPTRPWRSHLIATIQVHKIHGGVSPHAVGDLDGDGDSDVVTGQGMV